MKLKFNGFLILLLVFVAQITFAQERVVSGVVSDNAGLPLPGVSVLVKGTQSGTQTDFDGKYSIKATASQVLVFSYVGMKLQEAKASSASVNVKMQDDSQALEEVVVTGLGVATQKRKVGIDVASVSSKNFAKSVATGSLEQALTGQIAGASIRLGTGEPGAPSSIILRGINTLGSTYPMILVDGVETSDLDGLDPTTVDRIEVVKGAAGGMLYGAQGGNGVIQVFTKKGLRGGAPKVTFSTKLSVDQIIGKKDLLATNHHYAVDSEGYVLDVLGDRIKQDETGLWTEPVLLNTPSTTNSSPYKEKLFNHLDQGFTSANTTNHTLNISGGGDKSDYSFNVSRLDQENVMSNDLNRTTTGINLGFELFKNFTVRSTTQGIFGYENLVSGDRFPLINSYKWIDWTFRTPNGNLVFQPKEENQTNPLAEAEWRTRNSKTQRLVQSINLNYKFSKFIELDYKVGITQDQNLGFDYYKNQTAAESNLYFGSTALGSITKNTSTYNVLNSLATMFVRTDFQKDFNSKLPITTATQIAYDVRKTKFDFFQAFGSGLPNYPPYNINVATTKTSLDFLQEFLTYGFLANQSIDYGSLIGISAGIRSDYSSEFGGDGKPFVSPRGTIYFNPSDLIKKDWLSQWKIRAAFGSAGIQPGGYARQVTLDAGSLGDGVYLSLKNAANNPNLRVQQSKETEIGTDVIIANNNSTWFSRVSFTGTYWKKSSIDVIQNADVAPSSGFTSIADNLMTLKSKGIELSTDATMFKKENLTWDFGIRFAKSETRVDKIANNKEVVSGNFALKEGELFGIFYGQTPLSSVDQLKPDGSRYILAADVGNYEIVNGFVTNKTTNQVKITDADDKVVLGNPTPKFTMSFINNITINKNLTASFQVDWIYGNSVYNRTRQWLYRDHLSKDFDTPVTINGQTGAFTAYYNGLYNSVNPISWFAEDGSFVRLRDVSITYNLKDALNIKWGKALSITASGRNLFTITKYKGLDPESSTTGTLNRGVDEFGFPNLKSFQLGLNVGF